MRKIYLYLKTHLETDFYLAYYISIALFLSLCLWLNYHFDFEDSIIDSYHGKSIRILFYFLFYGFAYYSAILIMCYFKGIGAMIKKREFWIKSSFILFLLALDSSFHYHEMLVTQNLDPRIHYWARTVSKNLINIIITVMPMVILYKVYDGKAYNFYGLTMRGFDYKPYLFMLLVMVPLVFSASFIDNFNDFYPFYKANNAYQVLGTPPWVPAILYELAYGWNFLSVELMFRGFMILSLSALLGRNVIIPMVVTYCFYHFGKPEGEAISSVVGGYILGVIALESRSIFGGVMLHIGIAWLMEFFAWIQLNLR